jgi:hypothetical protein
MGTRKRLWNSKVLGLITKIQEQKQLKAVQKPEEQKFKFPQEARI